MGEERDEKERWRSKGIMIRGSGEEKRERGEGK